VLQALYNLSDEQTEYQILDRLSFMKFLGFDLHSAVPDARTIWLFRELLIAAQAVEKLFYQFDTMLSAHGFAASGGQIIDATPYQVRGRLFVEAPRQRNGRDDNKTIKEGKVPEGWSDKKKAHKSLPPRRRGTQTRGGRRKTTPPITAIRTTPMWTANIKLSGDTRLRMPAFMTVRNRIPYLIPTTTARIHGPTALIVLRTKKRA
jgi:IS5 family transposase